MISHMDIYITFFENENKVRYDIVIFQKYFFNN